MHTGEFRGAGPAFGPRPEGVLIDKQTSRQVLAGRVTIQLRGKGWAGSLVSGDRLQKAIRGIYRVMLTDGSLCDVNIEDVTIAQGTRIDFTGVGAPPQGT